MGLPRPLVEPKLGCLLSGIQFENTGNHSVARLITFNLKSFIQVRNITHRYELLLIFLKKSSIYLFLSVLGLQCRAGFSVAVASGGYSLAVTRGFLIALASPVAEQAL